MSKAPPYVCLAHTDRVGDHGSIRVPVRTPPAADERRDARGVDIHPS